MWLLKTFLVRIVPPNCIAWGFWEASGSCAPHVMSAFFFFDIMVMLIRGLQKSTSAVHKCSCGFPHDITLLIHRVQQHWNPSAKMCQWCNFLKLWIWLWNCQQYFVSCCPHVCQSSALHLTFNAHAKFWHFLLFFSLDTSTCEWKEIQVYFLQISSLKFQDRKNQLIHHIFTVEKSLVSPPVSIHHILGGSTVFMEEIQ